MIGLSPFTNSIDGSNSFEVRLIRLSPSNSIDDSNNFEVRLIRLSPSNSIDGSNNFELVHTNIGCLLLCSGRSSLTQSLLLLLLHNLYVVGLDIICLVQPHFVSTGNL